MAGDVGHESEPAMFYDFCRVHQELRATPAMETGLSDHLWEIEEIVNVLEASQ
jgi:hypothetical protein